MRWGQTAAGDHWEELHGDSLYVFDVGDPLSAPLWVGSLIARIDGLGSGSGEQRIRPVLLSATGRGVRALGGEVVVTEGDQAAWVYLPFDAPPLVEAGLPLLLGLWTGPAPVARISATEEVGRSTRIEAPFASITEGIYGLGSEVPDDSWGQRFLDRIERRAIAEDARILATISVLGVESYEPPTLEDDDLALLPLLPGQAVLRAAAATGSATQGAIGWNYDPADPPPTAQAIARTGGWAADLVGERVKLSAGGRSVVVVVADEQEFDDELAAEDLSISRPAFDAIAPLWTEVLTVRVEVLG